MANNQPWSEKEIKFLKNNYKRLSVKKLSDKLGRSIYSIYHKAKELNLTDKSKRITEYPWTFAEISIVKNNYQRIGLKQTCKLLNRTRAAIQAKAKKLGVQSKQTPSKGIREGKLRRKYGMSLDEYDKLFEQQNGVCAICGQPEIWKHQSGAICRLAVDHQHSDGKVRGLLCHHCNLLLGNAKDDIQILKSAIKYLKKKEGD